MAPAHARRFGGPSEVLRGLIPPQVAQGLDVRVISTTKGVDDDDVDFETIVPQVHFGSSRPPRNLNFAVDLLGTLREWIRWADVVHAHSVHTYTTSAALTLARRAATPVVLQPHGALDRYHLAQSRVLKSAYTRLVDTYGVGSVAAAIYSSQHELREGLAHLPRPAHLAPLGVEDQLFGVERHEVSPMEILYLGRITHKKRLDLLLEAFAASPALKSTARVIVAGPDDESWAYDPRAFVVGSGLQDRVQFVGPVDSRTRARLLARASVFVLPSEDESFGVAVAEALAAGVPVLTTDRVGLASAAASEDALRLCELDAESLRGELERLVHEGDERAALSRRGRAYASAHFTWQASAAAVTDVYRSVVG